MSKDIPSPRDAKTKQEFFEYCVAHPDERFWQAVRNFSEWPFILASDSPPNYPEVDTFYWESSGGSRRPD